LIIHLNGWRGVGKQTIGRALAERIGARFIHNHLLHDVAIVCARGALLIPVVLEADREEHFRRVQSVERIGRKLTDTAVLEEFFNIDKVHRPDVPELLVLDVTHLAPQEAAERIIEHASALGLAISGSDAK
jgi:hypothetical protein